ncbi:UNVERIFIED_ORG: hypothetical protein ABRZ91_001660 [Heyndrickxia coagulans]
MLSIDNYNEFYIQGQLNIDLPLKRMQFLLDKRWHL